MTILTTLKKRMLSLAVLITILSVSFFASTMPSNAASNVCSDINGNCNLAKTFEVTTDKGWLNNQSITLTQTKGRIRYVRPTWTNAKYKNITQYATYYVTVIDKSTGKYIMRNKVWKNSSMKIKLQKYKTYTVTIKPETYYTYLLFTYRIDKWTNLSTWKVKRTKHCTYCTW